VLVDSKGLHSG